MGYSRIYTFLLQRWWVAFILLGVSFVSGSLLTLNLLRLLSANFEFLSMYGLDAVRDGGLTQLLELVVSGYAAAACFVTFKLCGNALVERLSVNRTMGTDS